MPDRSQPPQIRQIGNLSLPDVQVHHLDNGIPLYEVRMGTQEAVKLEIVFHAGRPYEKQKLAARATSSLLREGSARYSGSTIADRLDFYGCSLSLPFNLDTANVILYSLSKHFHKALPILEDMLAAPTFPQSELDSFIRRNQRRLEVDLAKNDILAYRQVTERIFGAEHPYGYNSFPETYGALKREALEEHYRRLFTSGNCTAFLSGRGNDELTALINESLSRSIPGGELARASLPAGSSPAGKEKIVRKDSVQSAIRIGRRMFSRHHPDYKGMYVLNTILGGYFGSRLMGNIREEKGYTYNIYSSVDAMHFDGCFYIGTEVGNEFVEDTLRQCYREMSRLQEELVEAEELEMVRNYLLGNFLTMLDGPFNVSEVVRTQVMEGLPMTYFEELVETARTISAEQLRELARRYFRQEDFWEVVVGV